MQGLNDQTFRVLAPDVKIAQNKSRRLEIPMVGFDRNIICTAQQEFFLDDFIFILNQKSVIILYFFYLTNFYFQSFSLTVNSLF